MLLKRKSPVVAVLLGVACGALAVGQWAWRTSYAETAPPAADGQIVLKNAAVTVQVDAAQGGAITSMRFNPAMNFPFIADRGAGVAGEGRFFLPTASVNGQPIDLSAATLTQPPAGGSGEAPAAALSKQIAPGLTLTRAIHLANDESGLRITDTFANTGSSELKLKVGSASRQEADKWRQVRRTWIGDETQSFLKFSPNADRDTTFTSQSGKLFWRNIGQYGTGYLYQVTAPAGPVEVSAAFPRESGMPAELKWESSEITLAAGKSVAVNSAVLIDEGGRQGNDQKALAASDRVIVTTDLRAGGWTGKPILGAGTVVSATARKVEMSITATSEDNGQAGAQQEIVKKTLDLQPGKASVVYFDATPAAPGLYKVTVDVKDSGGKALGTSQDVAVIDGDKLKLAAPYAQQWKNFDVKMPESVQTPTIEQLTLKGSWEQIGAQMAQAGKIVADESGTGAQQLAFYRENLPFYAEMLEGAAAVMGSAPEKLAFVENREPEGMACMDTFFNGPDGPINAFSKERSNPTLGGLAYTKVLPTKGYAFHTYMGGCGVNSEGLSVSTATLNEDPKTTAAGGAFTKQWQKDGKKIIPNGRFVMLATCKNVDEAIAFLEHSSARTPATGNMLLVDREGNAARVESVGVMVNIQRYDPKQEKGFCVAGNYAHPNKEGLFQPGGFAWAANTMLREHWLLKNYGDRRDSLSLKDVFTIMETHEPGGQCQHIYDNPGALYSSCHFIAVTKSSDLWLSHGPPCRVKYVKYTLTGE